MSWVVAIIVGLVIGWIASTMKKVEGASSSGDLVAGLIGGLLGKLVFVNWLNIGGVADAGAYALMAWVWAAIGAIIVVAIVKAMR